MIEGIYTGTIGNGKNGVYNPSPLLNTIIHI